MRTGFNNQSDEAREALTALGLGTSAAMAKIVAARRTTQQRLLMGLLHDTASLDDGDAHAA